MGGATGAWATIPSTCLHMQNSQLLTHPGKEPRCQVLSSFPSGGSVNEPSVARVCLRAKWGSATQTSLASVGRTVHPKQAL
ncbi:mCG63603 [Mus musculus]|nr:mCG63603 [Mus musculus]